MSKIFIHVANNGNSDILEIDSVEDFLDVSQAIEKKAPSLSYDVYGARDFNTLKRTEPELGKYWLTRSFDEFMRKISA